MQIKRADPSSDPKLLSVGLVRHLPIRFIIQQALESGGEIGINHLADALLSKQASVLRLLARNTPALHLV